MVNEKECLTFIFNRFRITQKQKLIIDEAFEKLEMKQKEIMDSIYYAKRIQKALITSEFLFDKLLKNLMVNSKIIDFCFWGEKQRSDG